MTDMKTQTIQDLVWKKITRGVTDKLEGDATVIDKWSPNNLRRMIVSPEGVLIQPFITKGTFYNQPLMVVPFPISESTQKDLQSNKTITSLLYKDRVFSSIEEVVILIRSPKTPYTISPKELDTMQTHLNSFKRLSNIVVVAQPIGLQDFIKPFLKELANPYGVLAEQVKKELPDATIIPVVKDWYNHTALRPQFYTLDEEGKELYRHFNSTKDYFSNLEKNTLSIKDKGNKKEKSNSKEENELLVVDETVKSLLMLRYTQVTIPKDAKYPTNRLSYMKEYGVSELRKLKTGLGFNKTKDDKINKLLESLHLYEENGSTDKDKLEKLLKAQIIGAHKRSIENLGTMYPEFQGRLMKAYNSKSTNLTDITAMVFYDYKTPFNDELVLRGTLEDKSIKRQLVNKIDLSEQEVIDITQGILFSLGYSKGDIELQFQDGQLVDVLSGVNNLDLVIVHDLYIYSNGIRHRMYNHLFSTGEEGTKGFVKNLPVVERMNMLYQKEKDSEWETCIKVLDKLQVATFKTSFKEHKSEIDRLQLLRQYQEEEEEVKRQVVAHGVLQLIANFDTTASSKLTMVHAINKLDRQSKLGSKGFSNNNNLLVRMVSNANRDIEDKYASYLELVCRLAVRGY